MESEKDKMIEEMANSLEEKFGLCGTFINCGTTKCSRCFSKYLYEQNYRKIPDDSLVITNDNAEEIGNMIVTSPQMTETMEGLINAWQKETAKDIIKDFALSPRTRAMIAEKYGLSKEDLGEV